MGDVLGDTGGVASHVLEDVAIDAVRGGLLGVLAGTALVHQAARVLVLLGVEHVGTLGAEQDGHGHAVWLLGGRGGSADILRGRHFGGVFVLGEVGRGGASGQRLQSLILGVCRERAK